MKSKIGKINTHTYVTNVLALCTEVDFIQYDISLQLSNVECGMWFIQHREKGSCQHRR